MLDQSFFLFLQLALQHLLFPWSDLVEKKERKKGRKGRINYREGKRGRFYSARRRGCARSRISGISILLSCDPSAVSGEDNSERLPGYLSESVFWRANHRLCPKDISLEIMKSLVIFTGN